MRVYILSAYPAVRAGLAALLREQPGWSVVGGAAPEALARASGAVPPSSPPITPVDVLLADVDTAPEPEALDQWLGVIQPRGGVVLLGAMGSAPGAGRGSARPAEAARELKEVARATDAHGVAFGALPREATPEEIVAALTAVAGGLIALDRRLAGALLAAERAPTPVTEAAPIADDTLTARELEVLQLLAQGLPNKIIANRLHISEHTAKFHVSSIMTKLNAASRTEAVTLAARRGLLIL